MASDTRELLLDRAEALFAERGFYGASIAAIANELGLTKQALLHHYGSKERLYGEVLKRISERFETSSTTDEDPVSALKSFLLRLQTPTAGGLNSTRVLMRELLDNKSRADTAGTWYLKPFLEHLTKMVQAIPNWQDASDVEAFALVYQLLGAINYFGISRPTLTGIFGAETYADIDQAFPIQLERLIDAAISAGPISTA
ncbi:MAG: TetR/AcrR family transcriptional regulator [Henriciella sp.]|nr:TetR/AcrR family transcriptional regulator [Henriciella sp.]